jgi:hypothetical protein
MDIISTRCHRCCYPEFEVEFVPEVVLQGDVEQFAIGLEKIELDAPTNTESVPAENDLALERLLGYERL